MFKRVATLAKQTYRAFSANNAVRRGAAIAFYTVTSIGPILLLVIAVAGMAFGREAAQGALFEQFRSLLGSQSADVLQKAIASASSKSAGIFATVVSIVTLLATASGVFSELRDALNALWEAKPSEGLAGMARARLTSIGLVAGLGFLLMASLVVDAALKGFSGLIDSVLPFGSVVLVILSSVVSFALVTLLFAAILKFLPDKRLAWRDVVWGAAFTAFLFEIGKFLIGLYLAKSTTISSLGAAGALLALLFWIYYTAQIFLFGAAFTKVYARPAEQEVVHERDAQQSMAAEHPESIEKPLNERRDYPRPHRIRTKRPIPVGAVIGLLVVRAAAAKFLRRPSQKQIARS